MSDDDKTGGSPFSEEPTGGRYFLGALCLIAVGMLAIVGWQTQPGELGQTAMSGGWWAEPSLAPTIALIVTIVSAALAFFAAKREPFDLGETIRTYGQIALVAGSMVVAIILMRLFGFAISILLFATVAAVIGGFRGRRLVTIVVGATVAMVLIFRVGFKIWFPRPELFKWFDFPIWLQGLL